VQLIFSEAKGGVFAIELAGRIVNAPHIASILLRMLNLEARPKLWAKAKQAFR
jgi:hypothetical protein